MITLPLTATQIGEVEQRFAQSPMLVQDHELLALRAWYYHLARYFEAGTHIVYVEFYRNAYNRTNNVALHRKLVTIADTWKQP